MSELAVCRLCVNDCTEYKSLYSGYGRGNELHRLTLKYFHPELVDMDESTHLTVICSKCFSSIYDFHSFQTSVSVAQLKLLDYRSVTHVKIEKEKVVPQRSGKSPVATVKNKAASSLRGEQGNLNRSRAEHFNREDSNDSMETTICTRVHVNLNASDGQLVNTPAAKNGAESTRKSLRNKVSAETSATMEHLPDPSISEKWEDSAAKDDSFTDGDQTMPEYNWPECVLDATMGSIENEGNVTTRRLAADTSPSKMNNTSLEHYVHFDADENKFKCLICGHILAYKHHLLKHIQIRHRIVKPEDSPVLSEAKQSYECDMCPCSYTLKRNLQKHQQKEHPLVHGPKPLVAASASTSRLATVKASLALAFDINTRKYKCVLCATLFKKKENVQRHMVTKHKNHQGNTHALDFVYDKSLKKYKCGVCDSTYQYEGNILVHMKREHGQIRIMPEMNFPCPQCTTGFNSQRGLNRHLVSVHNTPIVYACTDCDRTFAKHSKFKYHRTTHNKVQLSPESKKQQKQTNKAAKAAANAKN